LACLDRHGGHSRPEDGVLSHAYVSAIHVLTLHDLKTGMPATDAGITIPSEEIQL
jgi:hypothetical protein